MELVYLWVEKYKNIENQGFNFSPRFRCEFKDEYEKYTDTDGKEKERLKDNCELIIDEKKDYVSIFPENINITAIVGENGSGKSTIIEILLLIQPETVMKYNCTDGNYFNYILIYRLADKLYRKNSEQLRDVKPIFINGCKMTLSIRGDVDLYHNELALLVLENNQEHNISYDNNEKIFIEYRNCNSNRIKSSIVSNSFHHKNLSNFKENFFTPNKVRVKLANGMTRYKDILLDDKDSYDEKIWDTIILKKKNLKLDKDSFSFMQSLVNILKIKFEQYDKNKNKFLDSKSSKTSAYFRKYRFFSSDDGDNRIQLDIKYEDLIKSSKFIEPNCLEFNLDNKEIVYFLFDLPNTIFNIELLDDKKSFGELSFGEKQLLTQLHFILYNSEKTKYKKEIDSENEEIEYVNINIDNMLILLDEFELGLHPKWQKKSISYICNFLKNINKEFNLIITSHSPFILSDLPKENIIFLEKGKQVYPFEDGKQTFGANIHTLLSHGFFMKDGLMGEFAKEKIQSIIKYHEDIEKKEIIEADKIEYKTKKQKEFWQIQSIIGDDYLKQVIKNHLVEIEKIVLGNDEAKEEEIKRLKAQIELLEK